MPLDWVYAGNLGDVARLLRNRFSGFMDRATLRPVDGFATHFDEEAFEDGRTSEHSSYFIEDTTYNILSVHDFPVVDGQPWDETYPAFKDRLERRTSRLLTAFAEASSILLVRWSGDVSAAVDARSAVSLSTAGQVDVLLLQPSDDAPDVRDREDDTAGVCCVEVPNRPGDPEIWQRVLQGMSLRPAPTERWADSRTDI